MTRVGAALNLLIEWHDGETMLFTVDLVPSLIVNRKGNLNQLTLRQVKELKALS